MPDYDEIHLPLYRNEELYDLFKEEFSSLYVCMSEYQRMRI